MNTYTITITFKRRAKFKTPESLKKWLTWFLGRGGASQIQALEMNEEERHDVA